MNDRELEEIKEAVLHAKGYRPKFLCPDDHYTHIYTNAVDWLDSLISTIEGLKGEIERLKASQNKAFNEISKFEEMYETERQEVERYRTALEQIDSEIDSWKAPENAVPCIRAIVHEVLGESS